MKFLLSYLTILSFVRAKKDHKKEMKKKAVEGVKNAAERVRQEKQMVRHYHISFLRFYSFSILIYRCGGVCNRQNTK